MNFCSFSILVESAKILKRGDWSTLIKSQILANSLTWKTQVWDLKLCKPLVGADGQITCNSGRMGMLNAKLTMDRDANAPNHLSAVVPTSE